jgi:hypothetical protein
LLQTLTKQLKKKSKDWDEDHALDLVMNDMVADLDEEDLEDSVGITEEELQDIIDQSGLKETVANIQQEMRDDIDQITKDFESTIADGIDELEAEESKEKRKPFNGFFKVKKAKAQGLIDQTIENRTVKPDGRGTKGPLYDFRTRRNPNDNQN